MKCPVDNVDLVMSERSGIEIDYCPTCRGVWLDRGELDKIVERSAPTESKSSNHEHRHETHKKPSYDDEYRYDDKHKKRRRESFLGDLFDF